MIGVTKIDGLKPLLERLKMFGDKVARQATRDALTKASAPLLAAAKEEAKKSSRTGALAASLGRKVAVKGATAIVVIGPRTGFKSIAQVKQVSLNGRIISSKLSSVRVSSKRGKALLKAFPKVNLINPVRYAHLVEKGHGGPRKAKPYPFLAPALARTESRVRGILETELKAEIDKLYAK